MGVENLKKLRVKREVDHEKLELEKNCNLEKRRLEREKSPLY